jgi:predicted nucleotide-binding protein
MSHDSYLFVSYAREDIDAVRPIIEALQEQFRILDLPVHVWVDIDDLRPGQQWNRELERVLLDSIGLLVFVSPAAMQSRWVQRELEAAADRDDRLIIPVILEPVLNLPASLQRWQWLDHSRDRSRDAIRDAAEQIAEATAKYVQSAHPLPPVSAAEAPALATTIAEEVRGGELLAGAEAEAPDSVFLVHGHDDTTLAHVDSYLRGLGIKTVVLSKQSGPVQSLFQKFLKSSKEARFAVVILTADDFGASRLQYDADDVGEKSLQFRARQNVILELGFFYGYLGWENVFVVFSKPDKVFPNFERPSDLDGVVFDTIDDTDQWREVLQARLAEAGFKLRKTRLKSRSR